MKPTEIIFIDSPSTVMTTLKLPFLVQHLLGQNRIDHFSSCRIITVFYFSCGKSTIVIFKRIQFDANFMYNSLVTFNKWIVHYCDNGWFNCGGDWDIQNWLSVSNSIKSNGNVTCLHGIWMAY